MGVQTSLLRHVTKGTARNRYVIQETFFFFLREQRLNCAYLPRGRIQIKRERIPWKREMRLCVQ